MMDWKLLKIFFVFFLGTTLVLNAQTNTLLQKAEQTYRSGDFEQAVELYGQLIKKRPNDAKINHRYGVALLETRQNLPLAEKHLRFSAYRGIRLSYRYLGEACFLNYKFEESKKFFSRYKSYLSQNDSRRQLMAEKITKCDQGLEWLNRLEDIQIQDTMIVPLSEFYSHYPLSKETGKFLPVLEVFSQAKDSLNPAFLPEREDRVYFSDQVMEDSLNLDLFSRFKLLDAWGPTEALSQTINTPEDEAFPFIMADGITLYFCSKGHDSFGGYDIYVTRYNTETKSFLPPKNLGMPFNSPFDDLLFSIDEFNETGWFASTRNAPKGKIIIYQFKPSPMVKLLKNVSADERLQRAKLTWINGEMTALDSLATEGEQAPKESPNHIIKKDESPIYFIVMDTLIYSSRNDFINKEALAAFHEAERLQNQLDSLSLVIKEQRSQYDKLENPTARQKFAKTILEVEERTYELQDNLDAKFQQARKEEVNEIKELLKQGTYLDVRKKQKEALTPPTKITIEEPEKESQELIEQETPLQEEEIVPLLDSLIQPVDTTALPVKDPSVEISPKQPGLNLVYRIQLGVFKNTPQTQVLEEIGTIFSVPLESEATTKYFLGDFKSFKEAKSHLPQVENTGFKGAFIIPLLDGKRISLEKAKDLEQSQ